MGLTKRTNERDWKIRMLKDLAEAIDLVIVGLARQLVALLDLFFHLQARIAVTGDIAHREIDALFDEKLVAADIRHQDLVLIPVIGWELILALDGIEEDAIGRLCEGKEAQLRVVEKAVDKMELDQRFLPKELGTVEQYFMILEIVDVPRLERRHADLPDNAARRGAEMNVMRRDQRFGKKRLDMVLGQYLMREIQIILIDKAAIKAFPLLVKRTIATIRQDPVRMGLVHSTRY